MDTFPIGPVMAAQEITYLARINNYSVAILVPISVRGVHPPFSNSSGFIVHSSVRLRELQ